MQGSGDKYKNRNFLPNLQFFVEGNKVLWENKEFYIISKILLIIASAISFQLYSKPSKNLYSPKLEMT